MSAIIGIDLSMNSPCVCRFEGTEFNLNNCTFHYLTDKKKFEKCTILLNGSAHLPYDNQEQRFDQLTDWLLRHISKDDIVYLEGYSFGSRAGLCFNIGEMTGVLKHKLHKTGITYVAVPPTVVKKFATQKGNAKKDLMYEAFYKETKFNLLDELNTKVGTNPQSDIVDAYWICKYGYTVLKK